MINQPRLIKYNEKVVEDCTTLSLQECLAHQEINKSNWLDITAANATETSINRAPNGSCII